MHVIDTTGLWYNGAQVEIYGLPSTTVMTVTTTVSSTTVTTQSTSQAYYSIVANGTTSSGTFYSPVLTSDRNYTVFVYTTLGTSANQTVFLGNSDDYVTLVIPRPQPPSVILTSSNLSPSTINPGTTFSDQVTFENEGGTSAFGSVLSVTVSSPFTLLQNGSVGSLGTLNPGSSKTFVLTIGTAQQAKPGAYQVGYTITYVDGVGNSYTTTGNLGIQVSGNPVAPNLIISSVSFNPASIRPGDSFNGTITIDNLGNAQSYNGLLAMTIPAPLSVVGSAASIALYSQSTNGSNTFTFSGYAPTSAKPGTYPVSYTLTYDDRFGTSYSATGSFSIVLVSPPTVLLQALTLGTFPLTPGTNTKLTMLVVNGGGDSALDVKVSWAGNAAFLSNSTSYLGALGPSASINDSFGFNIPASTTAGTYSSQLVVSYQDIKGTSYSQVIQFPITVQGLQVPVFTVTNALLDPPVLTPGTQGTFTIYASNTGTSAVNNVVITISNGTKLFSSNTFGLGTVAAGGQTTTVVGVNVGADVQTGPQRISIVATYTDQAGVSHSTTVPIELTVYRSTSIFTTANLIILAAVVIVAIAAIVSIWTFTRRGSREP